MVVSATISSNHQFISTLLLGQNILMLLKLKLCIKSMRNKLLYIQCVVIAVIVLLVLFSARLMLCLLQ